MHNTPEGTVGRQGKVLARPSDVPVHGVRTVMTVQLIEF